MVGGIKIKVRNPCVVLGLKQKLTEMGRFFPNQQTYAMNFLAQSFKAAET